VPRGDLRPCAGQPAPAPHGKPNSPACTQRDQADSAMGRLWQVRKAGAAWLSGAREPGWDIWRDESVPVAKVAGTTDRPTHRDRCTAQALMGLALFCQRIIFSAALCGPLDGGLALVRNGTSR
jgi:hypothetical protein